MRIAVIGAGAAGLASIRHLTKNFPNATVVGFEISHDIGGTWKYTDHVGNDKYGVPLTTNMYKNLRTNLPKQVMQFSELPHPPEFKTFMSHENFYSYLQNYAATFDLKKHIKFEHMVTLVKPKGDGWDVTYKVLKDDVSNVEEFDYVFVCNGHYNKMSIPQFPGQNIFKGKQSHSAQYRIPELYKDRNVLIIGSGPSGLDISVEVARVAKNVFLSHHWEEIKSPFPPNHIQKPDVKEFTENSVVFMDGSCQDIDDIIYCTGYFYYYPFLDPDCGIKVEQTHISKLYRHIVNIEHPSMFFIGVPQQCCAIPMTEYQAQYVMALLLGNFQLPTKDKMIEHMKRDYDRKDKTKYKLDRIATHMLGGYEPLYYSELSEESGIKPFPSVYCAIRFSVVQSRRSNLYTYRDHNYQIVDDSHFIQTFGEQSNKVEILRDSGRCSLDHFLEHRKDIEEEDEKNKVKAAVLPAGETCDIKKAD